jgi:hypothetical protein
MFLYIAGSDLVPVLHREDLRALAGQIDLNVDLVRSRKRRP